MDTDCTFDLTILFFLQVIRTRLQVKVILPFQFALHVVPVPLDDYGQKAKNHYYFQSVEAFAFCLKGSYLSSEKDLKRYICPGNLFSCFCFLDLTILGDNIAATTQQQRNSKVLGQLACSEGNCKVSYVICFVSPTDPQIFSQVLLVLLICFGPFLPMQLPSYCLLQHRPGFELF